MNKYKVKITHVFSEVVDVSANNEEEAKEKAKEYIQKENEMKATYDVTLPSEHWAVISEEQYNEMVKQFEAELENQKNSNKEESNIITPNIITP